MNDKKVREFLKVAELWHAGKSVKEIVPLSGVPERKVYRWIAGMKERTNGE